MVDFTLRPIAAADLETARLLRNRHRAFFFDDREITADQQRAWFEELAHKPVTFYVIEMDGHVIGTVSVSKRPQGTEIGNLILDEPYRGRGIMRRVVDQLTSEPGEYFAQVKAGNTPSLDVFRDTGFCDETVTLRKSVSKT